MAINTPQKEMPTVGGNPTAGGAINDLDYPTGQRPSKAFETLRAAYALRGYTLQRTDPATGPVSYWASRWGLAKHLPDIDAAQRFLIQIGGRL